LSSSKEVWFVLYSNVSYSIVILVSLLLLLFHSERESQLRATQEQAQKEIAKAWAHVKELQTKENQLKVWDEVVEFLW